MDQPTPARLFALLAGALLCVGGLAGFLVAGEFGTGDAVATARGELLGLDTNGWSAAFDFAVGLAGLIAVAVAASRAYAAGAGVLLVAFGVLALRAGDDGIRFDRFAVDDLSGSVHLVLGLLGLVAWLVTVRR